jgi:hypothetical protein
MVTFHVADSFPAALRSEWAMLLEIEDDAERRKKLQAYLDKGRGECALRELRIAGSQRVRMGCVVGLSGTSLPSWALRTGTVRGPGNWMQPLRGAWARQFPLPPPHPAPITTIMRSEWKSDPACA